MSSATQENDLSGIKSSKKSNMNKIDTHIQSDISKAFEKIEKMNDERVAKMVDELSSITEATIQKIEQMNEERESKIAASISNMAEIAIQKIQKMNEEVEAKRDSTMWEEKLVEWKKLY
ncbi:MAG: hypothetical protein WEC35_04575 [Nitrosopumilaceae archaeon]